MKYRDFQEIDQATEKLINILGEEVLLEELLKAIGYNEQQENIEYIARNYDIELYEEE